MSVCLRAIDSETVGPIGVKFFVRASTGPRADYKIPPDHIAPNTVMNFRSAARRIFFSSILTILTFLVMMIYE